jgi:multidrug efflux pump subunit AcrA (membrane-fusion protein)
MRRRSERPWHLYSLAGVAVLIVALAIMELGPPTSSARVLRQVVTAQDGFVQSSVSGAGNIAAGTDLDVNFQTSGTLSQVYVKLGQHVHKGQLLATLDPTSAQLSVDQAKKNLISAEDQLTAAKDGTSSGSSSAGSSSTTTTASLTTGTAATEYVSYVRPASAQAATSTTPTSTTPTTSTPTTSTPTTSTPTTSTPTTTKPTTAATPTTTTPSTTPAATTPSAGSSGGTGTGTSATSSASSIASAEASVYGDQSSLHTAETALAETKLYAPVSGTIVSLSSLQPGDSISAGSNSSSSGSSSTGSSSSASSSGSSGSTTAGSLGSSSSTSSSSSSSFAEIVNTGQLTMTVALSESDISKVRVGQAANVTLDALSNVELGAHVTSISTVGTTSSSVVSYNVTLTLDQTDRRVKPGMSASASIITGQAQGVTVPNDAVSGSGSLATVNLQRDGKTVSQQVVVGVKGDSRTQIISGIKTGAQLVVTTTLPSLGSTSSSGSSSSGTLGSSGRGLAGGGLGGSGGFPSGGGGGCPGGGGGFPGGG